MTRDQLNELQGKLTEFQTTLNHLAAENPVDAQLQSLVRTSLNTNDEQAAERAFAQLSNKYNLRGTQFYHAADIDRERQNLDIDEALNTSTNNTEAGTGVIGGLAGVATAIALTKKPQIIEEDKSYSDEIRKIDKEESRDQFVEKYKKDFENAYGRSANDDDVNNALITREVDQHNLARQRAYQNLEEKSKKGNFSARRKVDRFRKNELKVYKEGKDPTLYFHNIKATQIAQQMLGLGKLKGEEYTKALEKYRQAALKKLLGSYWLNQQNAFERLGRENKNFNAKENLEKKRSLYTPQIENLTKPSVERRPIQKRRAINFNQFVPRNLNFSFSPGFRNVLSNIGSYGQKFLGRSLNLGARGLSNIVNAIPNIMSRIGGGISKFLNNMLNRVASTIAKSIAKIIFSSPIFWAILGVFVVVVGLSFLPLFLGGPGFQAATTTSSSTPISPIGCSNIASGDISGSLQQNFNITVTGESGSATFYQNFYQVVCTISNYKFINLIGLPTVHITMQLNSSKYGNGSGFTCVGDFLGTYNANGTPQCSGKANTYTVFIGQNGESFSSLEFVVMHEFAHIVQFRNGDLENQFCTGPYGGKLAGNNCIKSGFNSTLPTYNCRYDYGTGPFEPECFSDMVGEYFAYTGFIDVVQQKDGSYKPADYNLMQDYPGKFSSYYNFATQNIFVPLETSPEQITNISTNYVPPSSSSCGGKYSGSNYGDPNCDFTKNGLASLIKNLDSTNYDIWFNTVARGESQYNPNAYLKNSASGFGAYGLFQMNPKGKSSQYDVGNVNWQLQTSNAINYNNLVLKPKGQLWHYWATACQYWQNFNSALCIYVH